MAHTTLWVVNTFPALHPTGSLEYGTCLLLVEIPCCEKAMLEEQGGLGSGWATGNVVWEVGGAGNPQPCIITWWLTVGRSYIVVWYLCTCGWENGVQKE